MNQSDYEFFEEYKRLDKLCGEMLSCNNGVSEYIAQMERSYKANIVDSWNTDLKNLKHLRWVRNQIAHDTSGIELSTESDLIILKDFYDRIFEIDDPLARLRKKTTQLKKQPMPHSNISSNSSFSYSPNSVNIGYSKNSTKYLKSENFDLKSKENKPKRKNTIFNNFTTAIIFIACLIYWLYTSLF